MEGDLEMENKPFIILIDTNISILQIAKWILGIHLPSGLVNFSFHLPLLDMAASTAIWGQMESMIGFLTNQCFQLNG